MDGIHLANVRKVDLGTLVVLQRLLADPCLSRVGKEVGLSQPAMSHLLARLRLLLGDPLLVREGNRFVVTARGAALQGKLDAMLPEALALFDADGFDPSMSKALFKIALTDHASHVLLPNILQRLRDEAPSVRSSIAMIPNRQTDLADLDEGQYDLRIGWLRALPSSWRRRKLFDDQIILVTAPDHPILDDEVTVDRFLALDHVGLESERPSYPNMVDSLLADHGYRRNVVARVSHFSMVPELVAGTRLVAIVPRMLAQSYAARGTLRIVEPPLNFPPNNVSMAWHPRVHQDRGHGWLRQMIVELARRRTLPAEASAAAAAD